MTTTWVVLNEGPSFETALPVAVTSEAWAVRVVVEHLLARMAQQVPDDPVIAALEEGRRMALVTILEDLGPT